MIQYDEHNESSFLVLMESSREDRNIGRYDPIALGKLIVHLIKGERRIFTIGKNQVKIWCHDRNDANILLKSDILTQKGFRTFVPESLLFKKGFIRIHPEHPVTEIVNNMDEEQKEMLIIARKRANRRNDQESGIIDLVFRTIFVSRFVFIWSVRIFITPSIPIPKRCNYCQHFGHVSQHCKATVPICEHC